MLPFNTTNVKPSTFILIGIPNLEAFHSWISVPFCSMYIVTLVGNWTILAIIKSEQSLHSPMYYFLCILAFIDLFLSSSITLKMLSIFWFNSREITFEACLMQMFFVHTFSAMESGVLLAMAFDRYIAICDPLRYVSVLTNPVIVKMGLVIAIRGTLVVIPCPVLAKRLSYCRTNVISHSYCDHMAVVKLSCTDTSINSAYGLTAALSVIVLDIFFITVSYVMILRAVLGLPSKAARHKAFSTCSAHICVILLFYSPGIYSGFSYRYGHIVAPQVHILFSNLYLLLPPTLNPIVYGIKTKQIRVKVLNIFSQKKDYV
ncbi:olfactory receptor 52N4-like [Rhinatrema bivittatum]|uniref:olfactory receptor 52N4-like n=1 Tax=Rhinatrema bivittatum TaxID=194408 RepID=UPI00112AB227|nr:olfactory receptor 52N4-like [Rhinatrema bivittatum]